jgi:hypothetical protein
MHQRDISNVMQAHGHRAGAHLMALERQRSWLAEAELSWQLKHGQVLSAPTLPIVMQMSNEIGIALVRAGRWLAHSKACVISPATNVTVGRGDSAT